MQNLGTSLRRVTTSSNSLTEASAEQHRKTVLAAERTKLLLDCFRTGGASSPETFVTAVAATLARYPDQVIYEVTDPRSGLPSKLTWMPSIKEVADACNAALEPIRQHELRLKRIKEQMEMREREERGEKPTLEQLQAKYGKDWGLDPTGGEFVRKAEPAPAWDKIVAMYQAQPGRITELADSMKRLRGDITNAET